MANTNTKERIIVIGNGMVGYKFCERLYERYLLLCWFAESHAFGHH